MRTPNNSIWLLAGFVYLVGGCSKEPDQVFLSCVLTDSSKTTHRYSFEFKPNKPYLFWVEGSQELKVIRNTDSQLWCEHSTKYQLFQYDVTSFQLNRVTGSAIIYYARKPTTEEVAKCMKDPGWGCDSWVGLAEHTETGHCQVRERQI